MNERLASPQQLWALNRAGRLSYVQEGGCKPLSSAEANEAIKHSMSEAAENGTDSAEKLVSA